MKLLDIMMFSITLMLDVASIAVPIINIINRIVAGILDDVRRLNGMYHMLYKIHQQQRTDNSHDNGKGYG